MSRILALTVVTETADPDALFAALAGTAGALWDGFSVHATSTKLAITNNKTRAIFIVDVPTWRLLNFEPP
jgi:hypothetical protein